MISNKKFLLLMSITVLLLIFISNIIGYSSSNFNPKDATTTANVIFRKAPVISSSNIIKTVPSGTNVKIVGEISDFYIVLLKDNQVGVLSKSYVKENEVNNDNSNNYENLEKYYVTVNDNNTNLRGGPGTNFASYSKLNKNDKLEVIGKIGNFLLVITENNMVGMVREDLVSKVQDNQNENIDNSKLVLDLINKARSENNLPPLAINDKLNEVAMKKAEDMVNNNYFSHTSPSYGDPFKMMQNFGISYKTVGENIAGNSDVTDAVNSLLNSETHKKNILSSAYNYVGIGVVPSEKYGYIIVVMFIRKIKF